MYKDEDDLFYLKWCLQGERLSDFEYKRNENQIVNIIPFEGEYKEYLQKLIDNNLN